MAVFPPSRQTKDPVCTPFGDVSPTLINIEVKTITNTIYIYIYIDFFCFFLGGGSLLYL